MTQNTIIIWGIVNTAISILNLMVLKWIIINHKNKLASFRSRLENLIQAYEKSIEEDISEAGVGED